MLAVGRIAAQNLLRTDKTLGTLRQQVHRFGRRSGAAGGDLSSGLPVAYAGDKRKAWEDLKFARDVCSRV